ncbi:MAG: dicarboxylate/amino acid:cation symporter [Arenimonas sp.]|jgi:Na+/H+-dicarboxylate symporter
MKLTASTRVFLGLILGVMTGIGMSRFTPDAVSAASAVAQPIGKLWLNALQMTIVPLVVSLLVVGINQANDIATSGRIARKALVWIVSLLFLAGLATAITAPFLLGFMAHNPELMDVLKSAASPALPPPAGDWTTTLIPTNVLAAAVTGAIVPLVAFTLLFAFALTQVQAERRALIVNFFQGIADTVIRMVHWILLAGPIGVFALILPISAQAGGSVIQALGIYIGMLCVLYLGITAILYGIARIGNGDPLLHYARAILPAQVVAMSTQSSVATLPAMVESAGKLGYPGQVTGLVLPLAVSLFRITSPIQYLGVVSFIAWAYGIELPLLTVAICVALSVVISIGSVGLPGQAIFMGTNLPVVQAAGLPVEPLGLLVAVDMIPDIFATLGNVTADLTVTSRVARAESAALQPPQDIPGA